MSGEHRAVGHVQLLKVINLRSGYGRIPIVNGLSFSVAEGEFVGILGHNGMGKTTVLRTLMGYLPAYGGTVELGGKDVTRRSTTQRARAGIGYVPQGREIFPGLSVIENLRMGCLLNAEPENKVIEEILTFFPRLKAYLGRIGGALSGGEQQLLALARCLCGAPRIVLLDEPTEGIQPSIIEEMISTLRDFGEARNLTILLVEQNLSFLSALSHRILVLQKGMITGEMSPEIARYPALIHDFVGLT
ncbi:ABC transporter ATP-binding protein [Rhizobium lusitanum]|uniref:ABC transporter ATP-binding protein n=1 Tax=Rhizobium lusitanum TaxID=293958 RepID=UPI001956AE3B|nr:ABC transporter ATP-binding protein [Rhizobium lusitanum]MBM7046555.1 ABC transporter ATP-binding protein [Rhizobium lusitanum]